MRLAGRAVVVTGLAVVVGLVLVGVVVVVLALRRRCRVALARGVLLVRLPRDALAEGVGLPAVLLLERIGTHRGALRAALLRRALGLALAAAVGRRRRRKGERRRSDDRDDPLRHALILLIWLAVLPVASTHGRARGWAVRKGAQKTSGRGEDVAAERA